MSNNKKVVNSKTVLTAPNLVRLGAFLVDQVILTVIFILYFAIFGSNPSNASFFVYIGALIISIAYRTIYPIFISKGENTGQTIGKKLLKLRTISANGTNVTVKQLLIRNIFMLLIEGFEFYGAQYLVFAITLIGFPAILNIYYMQIIIAFASIGFMLIKPSHQMLHDYVSNTVVILVKQ